MTRHSILTLSICASLLAATQPLYATERTAARAEAIANQFLSVQSLRRAPAGCPASISAERLNDRIWLCRSADHSLTIIIPADDSEVEVAGYFEGGDINPTLSDLLASAPALASAAGDATVAPLLGNIAWDQLDPFNLLTPCYVGQTHSATGCAATAMAQVMRYYKWPAKGVGSKTYTCETLNQQLTSNFADHTYQWADMLPKYDATATEAQRMAVAQLMFDCGVSLEMEYGAQSGALPINWCYALADNFDYNRNLVWRTRAYYTQADWDGVLDSELVAGRPVLITGYSSAGGHAFVIDGAESGYYHVNWGWTGMSNGYFLSSLLTPPAQDTGGSSGGFNSRQVIATGIAPSTTPIEDHSQIVATESMRVSANEVANDTKVTIKLGGRLRNVNWKTQTLDLGYAVYGQEGLVKHYNLEQGYQWEVGANRVGMPQLEITPADFNPGSYLIYPVASLPGAVSPDKVLAADAARPVWVKMEVGADNTRFITPGLYELEATDITPCHDAYSGLNFQFTATIRNLTTTPYEGSLTPVLLNASGTTASSGEPVMVSIAAEETIEVTFNQTFTAAPATYTLAILDDDRQNIGSLSELELKSTSQAKITATEAITVADAEAVDPLHMTVKAQVKAEDGVFSGTLLVFICQPDGMTIANCLNAEYVFANPGETVAVTFTGRFENALPETEYKAVLADGLTYSFILPKDLASASFTTGKFGGLETIASESLRVDGRTLTCGEPMAVYTLTGTEIAHQAHTVELPAGGIYLVRIFTKTIKITVK